MTGRGPEDHQVLRRTHIQQEFRPQSGEVRPRLVRRALHVTFESLDQAQLANIARERDLRGAESDLLERLRQLFLRRNPLRSEQLQDLAVAIALTHTRIDARRSRARTKA